MLSCLIQKKEAILSHPTRLILGIPILFLIAYLLNACSTTLPRPNDLSAQQTIESYRARARAVTLDPDTSFAKRDKSQIILDELTLAEQTDDEGTRTACLEQVYDQLKSIER